MTTKKAEAKTQVKAARVQYSAEFRRQALLRAMKDGVPMAARDLGLQPARLYAWHTKAQQQGQNNEVHRLVQSETARLKRELARLEEENAFLKKAAAYFAGLVNVRPTRRRMRARYEISSRYPNHLAQSNVTRLAQSDWRPSTGCAAGLWVFDI